MRSTANAAVGSMPPLEIDCTSGDADASPEINDRLLEPELTVTRSGPEPVVNWPTKSALGSVPTV